MNEPYVPDGYSRLCPYLTVIDAARLIDFIVAVFGASVEGRHERPDGKIMHAALRIGDSHVEISDPSEQWGPTPSAIHIYVPDVDVVYRRALEHGNNWYIATYLRDKATAGTASS